MESEVIPEEKNSSKRVQKQETEICDSRSENGVESSLVGGQTCDKQGKLNNRMMPYCKVLEFLAERCVDNSEARRNNERF